jgi:hypothetical protein
MKKLPLAVIVTTLAIVASSTWCSAQLDRTVTNTSKKGSLLIWPLIKATPADTIIKLNNEYYKSVRVKCSYRIPFPSRHVDWVFDLLPNQPISWMASTGRRPDGKAIPQGGESPPRLDRGLAATLSCWAVDASATQQIAWNWLTGDAIVGEGSRQHWQYNAWRFAVNSSTTGADAGSPGVMLLSGDSGNYDACPTALSFNVQRQAPNLSTTFAAGTANNQLTLVPCAADLRTNSDVTVFTELQVRDENGDLQPGASAVVGSSAPATDWFSDSLTSLKLSLDTGSNPFVKLTTPRGNVLVHGRRDVSAPGAFGVPIIGVLSTQFASVNGPFASVSPTAAGPGQAYFRDANDENTAVQISIMW